ncbi:hypothetical protein EB796_018802 [Bugula neritina]|uniref:Uncharacterized protein n=1 Tax=Bugula neritina TaxID=10212 RepID=A0A7J7J9I5_BUGNE|nr:hypothetical protein EB796_018802 [Bugula neritina]
MDIGLTSPSDFKITDDNCLDCNGGYNFTYGVQVSHSFPATNAKLRFAYKRRVKQARWRYIGLCPIPREPASFYDTRCETAAPNLSPSWNVTPDALNETRQFFPQQGASFDVEVGKSFKNVAIFRMTSYDETLDELCSRSLNSNRIEFRVWFIRVCYSFPIDKYYLLDRLGLEDPIAPTTSPAPFTGGNVNFDLQLDSKPV